MRPEGRLPVSASSRHERAFDKGTHRSRGAVEGGERLDPHETYTSSRIDTRTGAIGRKGRVTTLNGLLRKAEGVPVHDFGVTVESNGKAYDVPAFVTAATGYLNALVDEINEDERLSGRG